MDNTTKPDQTNAINSMHKSIRLLRLKKDSKYTQGLRLTSRTNIGVVFPFVTDREKLYDGVKTILGYNYYNKILRYYIPKRIKVKEKVFFRKELRYSTTDTIDLTKTPLNTIKFPESVFLRRNKDNFLFDFIDMYKTFIPEDTSEQWASIRGIQNIDNVIYDWLKIILQDVNHDGKSVQCIDYLFGGSISSTHEKIIVCFNIDALEPTDINKYLNPTKEILRTVKINFKKYSQLLILRAMVAGISGYKEDEVLNSIYNVLKDYSVVFINNSGFSILLNTSKDEDIVKHSNTKFVIKFETLIKHLINLDTNDTYIKDIAGEFDDVVVDKSEDTIVSTTDTNLEKLSKVFDNIPSSNRIADKLLSKITKKVENDEDINDIEVIDNDEPLVPIDEEEEENVEIDDEDDLFDDLDIDGDIVDPDETGTKDIGEKPPIDSGEDSSDGKDDAFIKELENIVGLNTRPEMSAAQEKRLLLIKDKYKSIKVDNRSLEDILADKEATIIDSVDISDKINLKDTSFNKSNLVDMEKSYMTKTLEKDLFSVIKDFSNNKSINLNLIDIEKDDTSDQLTSKFTYKFKFMDDKFKQHTVKVDVPKIDKDGFMTVGGNRKVLKKQFILYPVVKVTNDKVMVSTSDNKCFIYRQGEVLSNNVSILFRLLAKELKLSQNFNIYHGDNSKLNQNYITNIEYDIISAKYHKFRVGSETKYNDYIFNQKEIVDIATSLKIRYDFSKPDRLPIGINYVKNNVIDIDINDPTMNVCDVIINDIRSNNIIPDIDSVISKTSMSKKRMYSRIELQSKDYCIISMLGSLYGLSHIIRTDKLNVQFTPEKLKGDKRVFVKFSDGYLYYDDRDIPCSLLLNGLLYMKPEQYTYSEFDTVKPYLDYFYDVTGSRNCFKGFTGYKDTFIDSITKGVLEDLGLPTEFLELFLYANSLLTDNKFIPETSMENYRLRTFETIPVILYKALSAQYKLFKQSGGTSRISIQQDQIFVGLHKAFLFENYDCTNPMNELKSKSICSMKGVGGVNSARAFTLAKRAYHEKNIGTIAISSVDNGSVGITKQLVSDLTVLSTRGYLKLPKNRDEIEAYGTGKILSFDEAEVPFTLNNSPNRIGFISTQTKHIIKCTGASIPVVSTGLDKAAPYYVGSNFVQRGNLDGVVKLVDEEKGVMIVDYKDGTSESINIGSNIVRNSSFFFENYLTPKLKVGDTFKKNDILAYEKDFYKKDIHGNIRGSQGVLAKLALHEKSTTDDDSSPIAERLAELLSTETVDRKQIMLEKSVNIISYTKIGKKVLKGDPLVVFEDAGDSSTNEMMTLFGDASEDILAMSRQTPKANCTGEIIDIKVYFTNPLEEYSESIIKFVKDWFKSIQDIQRTENKNNASNTNTSMRLNITSPMKAGADMRLNGAIVPADGGILIEYYIKHRQGMGVGHKITHFAMIKSVIAQVIPQDKAPLTEDGIELDGVMGGFSLTNRMCVAPAMAGVMGHILVEESKKIARKYMLNK